MGMSVHLSAYLERDDKYRAMVKAYNACRNAGAVPPKEIMKHLGVKSEFEHVDPELGVSLSLEKHPTANKIQFQLSW